MDFKSFFLDYFKRCLNEGIDINIHEMRTMASSNTRAADIAFKELWDEGIITGEPSMNVFEPGVKLDNFDSISLTQKGIEYIKQRSITQNATDYYSNINSAFSAYQNTINQMQLNLQNISNATQLHKLQNSLPRIPNISLDMRDSFTPAQIEQINQTYSNIAKQIKKIYGQKHTKGLQNYLNTVEEAQKSLADLMKEPPSNLYKELTKEPENKIESDIDKYTFEGILGRNCGTIAKYYGSEPRLLEKGFIVEEGTYVLRGYAKMSDLVGASIVDKKNYQRTEDIQHIKDIKAFLQKGKIHFLPEVVLVARNEVEIQEIDFNLKGKQLGRFKNINYRKIIVAPKSLYRVDGNHRLEAYEESQKDYYIPFSIILWHVDEGLEKSQEQSEKQKKNDIDNEAFLFYLLNAKSKPLTLEDNIKGIVKSDVDVWKDENIKDVNFIFPHLRGIYNDLNDDSLFKKYHYIDKKGNSNVWTQYLSILNRIFIEENKDKKIEEEYTISFDKEHCKEMVCKTILLLSQTTRFKYLREHYNKFPQLVFYLHYLKFLDTKNEIDIENDLEDINTWAEKYKHDDNSFENPINMYKNAMKQIQRGEINIFVAMPYYSKDCIKQFNLNYKKVIEEIIKKKPKLNNRLNLFPIMEHTGETKNILSYIDDCIDKCQIFIADVSDDPAKNNIVNPNVMYELGVARQKKKPCIIIRNAENESELIFDIKPMSMYPLKFENPDVNFVPEMIKHIEEIIEKYYIS